MPRPFLTNPLQLKPRAPRLQEGATGRPIDSYDDFEPRLRYYLDEVRRHWPGEAPVSWKEAIRLRQWPGAYPGVHWAALECVLELGRASKGGSKEITLAWQTLALGVLHVIVDGGGLPQGLPSTALAPLLKRAEECLPSFENVYRAGFVSVDEIARALKQHAQHPEVRADRLREGFVSALGDTLEFRERLHAPPGTDLVSALHYVLVEHSEVFALSLQLSAPEPPSAKLVSEAPAVPSNESDSLLQSLLAVEHQMGFLEESGKPAASESARLPRGEAPRERRSVREVAVRLPSQHGLSSGFRKPIPRLVPRSSAEASRRPSDSKTEGAWSRADRHGFGLSGKLQWFGAILGGACLLVVLDLIAGNWTSKARATGEEVQSRETGLPNPLDTVDAFAYASTVEERIALLQDPGDADAARRHFASVGDREFEVDYVQTLGNGRSGGHSFYASRVRFQDGTSRLIAIQTDPDTGRLSVDWHAYARTGSMPWSALMQGGGDGALIRAFVKRGNYYNFAFEDVERFACYQIISADTEEVLYGYVELRSKRRHALLEELLVKNRRQRMVLQLREPTGEAESIQYWIGEVVANDWVLDPAGSLERSAFALDVGPGGDPSNAPVWGPAR